VKEKDSDAPQIPSTSGIRPDGSLPKATSTDLDTRPPGPTPPGPSDVNKDMDRHFKHAKELSSQFNQALKHDPPTGDDNNETNQEKDSTE